ncbi:hypothetical protein GCM10011578_101490 [Streptomyces fuscichromogenes]|uniref:Uncharacterized protein n=1 Tax=Streptomyces fuscichromogenes TaxID=1324013 RepID=A0A917XRK0_9ACTN|nr:hypothetical protein GCM10011578_101490 [Streptomyces fuscichromogenes]
MAYDGLKRSHWVPMPLEADMLSSPNQPTTEAAIRASWRAALDSLIGTYLDSLDPHSDLTLCAPKPWSVYPVHLHTITGRTPSVRKPPPESSL